MDSFLGKLGSTVCALALIGCAAHPARQPAATLAAPAETFRFVVYGDTRDGHDEHRKLVSMIMKQKPEVVIQTGDLVHNGGDPALWKIYDDITGDMRRKVIFLPAMGNHEAGADAFKERVTAHFTSGNKLFYSIDVHGCHFVCLDIDEQAEYSAGSAQYRWLEKDLADAHARQNAGNINHIFVFFHVPPYSIGYHGSDLNVRKTLCPLFSRNGVRAVFNGHDHNYYRTFRDGILYIVTGGGGAPLYPVFPAKGAVKGDVYESVHHIVVVDVTGTEVKVRAIRDDGSELDSFSMGAPKS